MRKVAAAVSRSDFGRRRFGDLLVQAQLLTEQQFELAYQDQIQSGGRLNDALIRRGVMTEESLAHALMSQLGLAAADMSMEVDRDLLALVPKDFAETHQVVPLAVIAGRTLVVGTSDPLDFAMIDWLRARTGCYVEPRVATRTAVLAKVERLYGASSAETPRPVERARTPSYLRSVPKPPSVPPELASESPAFRLLVKMLAEKGVLSLDDYLQRLRSE